MKKRHLAGTLAAAAGAFLLARAGQVAARDLTRYDRLRGMSNEGPVMEETPEMLMQVLVQERHFVANWIPLLQSLPKDIARYIKIESM